MARAERFFTVNVNGSESECLGLAVSDTRELLLTVSIAGRRGTIALPTHAARRMARAILDELSPVAPGGYL